MEYIRCHRYGVSYNSRAFNGDLSRWDTTNVTTMQYMFYDAHALNGGLSRLDASNVIDMHCMFGGCPIPVQNKPPCLVQYDKGDLSSNSEDISQISIFPTHF